MNAIVDEPASTHAGHGLPWILALDQYGQPGRWISWQSACTYHAREMVAWCAGEHTLRILGGINRLTGQRSEITTHSIIALRGRTWHGSKALVPHLSNRELFNRDRQVCAYCGQRFAPSRLTRDHVRPLSQGGLDTWMNVVTACGRCNQRKSGRTPEQAHMPLLYAPYVPNRIEYLILSNRHILADQMDFLARCLPERSRLRLP